MKFLANFMVVILFLFITGMPVGAAVLPEEMELQKAWISAQFRGETANVPFSFRYSGQASGNLLPKWQVTKTMVKLDENRQKYLQSYTDPQTGLEVRCEEIEYLDFPTAEWVVYLKNIGGQDTPILEDIEALDLQLTRPADTEFVLQYHTGGHSGPRDYEPLEESLVPDNKKDFTTWGGFPTANHLPFFNLEWHQQGIIIGLGWPGMWAAHFQRDSQAGLSVRIGQECTHLKLQPGEEIRTPLMVLQFWKGNRTDSQNTWRRWMVAHGMPRPGGKLPEPILAGISSGDADLAYQSEENQKIFLDGYQKREIPIQYWWIDAGWYPNKGNTWQDLLGTWYADPKRFPQGLRAVSDSVHQRGMKMIVWFEPERVAKGSWLFENHPEWLLGDGDSRFFNHGNPLANTWLTNHIDNILTQEGIDLYRQDFAVFARPFWEQEDQKNPERQGMTENKHVVGYLKYLDELRRRHPEMLIDICSAGGKRLEMENLRRAVPLWRSDYVSEPVGTQCQTYGLAYWLPFFGTGIYAQDAYTFRSNMCPSTLIIWDVRNDNADYPYLRRLIQQWREVVDNYYGDYYPLTPYSTGSDQWIGWQFDRPEAGEGMVQMFCRTGTMYDSGICKLKGLEPEASYDIHDFDQEDKINMTGKELAEKGLRIHFRQQPGAALIMYKKIK